MDIQILGAHNCETQKTKCLSLLIDDVLVIDAGSITSSLALEAQQKLKAILLTHYHYDHVRDVPLLAMNLFLQGTTTNIYSTLPVYEALASHLLDGKLYPNFLQTPRHQPTINFTIVEPYHSWQIDSYSILPVPVSHAVPTIGYQITCPDGKKIFYTGDTGTGLSASWEHISPHILFVEVTMPNRYREFSQKSGHLTADLLERELVNFRAVKGYLPQVVLVHMTPALENEIATEIDAVSKSLGTSLTMAYEGMQIHL